jgi:hypothetical protein
MGNDLPLTGKCSKTVTILIAIGTEMMLLYTNREDA